MTVGQRPPSAVGLAVLMVLSAAAYVFGLSWAPIHPHFDEIRFAEQARSIAASGTDLNGRFLPLYFQMDGRVWFHPIGVYLPALAFKVLPVSVLALRAPTVLVGMLNVVLVYFIGRRLFRRNDLALLAGALLALTPAHFIHSRMAVDYLFPLPFVLGWMLLVLRFLETRAVLTLFLATSLLGFGIYSYIAAVALMPLLALVTLVLLWIERAGPRPLMTAIAGFAWPIMPAVLFIASHPEMLGSTLGRYGMTAADLDPFQQVREMLTPWFLSDRANLFASFFAPGYLFITGGGSLVGSTRTAGVFLILTLPLMLIGFRILLMQYSATAMLVLAGVLVPAVAASVVNEQFAVGRALTMVPFAILMAVYGVQAWSAAKVDARVPALLKTLAWVGAAVSVAYVLYRAAHGSLSPGGVVGIGIAAVLLAVAGAIRRTQSWWPLTALLLAGCLLQFALFASDYFGDYRARSAYWFNGNLKEAIVRIVDEIDRRPESPVLLDPGIAIVDWYWRFHLAELGRNDLAARASLASRDELAQRHLEPGTLILLPADNYDKLIADQRLTLLASITDPNDRLGDPQGGEHPSYLVFQAPF